nr:solute carrier family 23 protein [Amphibacillus cookii]
MKDKPSIKKSIPLAFQHILAMFAANATLPLLMAALLELSAQETTVLIQSALFISGVTTIIQVVRIKSVGSGLPIVMGTSNAFISTSLAIAADFGIGAVFGAAFIGGMLEFIIGKNLKLLHKLFPPLIGAIVVLTIGITLIPVGIEQAAGSVDTGSIKNLSIASMVLTAIIFFHQSKYKFLKSSSILFGIVIGYLISFLWGLVDLSEVANSNWVSFPQPLQYRWSFEPVAIISMVLMYLATSIETLGDVAALTKGAEGREPTDKEMSGAIMADGLSSSIAALFNAFPNTSYTQNVGVVNITGVFSKHIVKVGGDAPYFTCFSPEVLHNRISYARTGVRWCGYCHVFNGRRLRFKSYATNKNE